MKVYFKTIIILSAMFLLKGCETKKDSQEKKPMLVEIKAVETGGFSFFLDGEPFEVKGVGGNSNYKLLKESGGNAFRTWSANDAAAILDSAYKYDLKVALGLPMGQELHHFDYDDSTAVSKQFNKLKETIDLYKNHPSLLCWVVGNELNLTTTGQAVNPKVYDALREVTDYIHEVDPNHPVTTAFAGVNKEQIDIALERCPNLDFLSFQVYGGLNNLPEAIEKAGVKKPYAVTEFGPIGHWEVPKTEWGREIEEPSAVKAEGIAQRMRNGLSDKNCLGGFAFLWGQKQERTPTWYGMFLKSGESNATVDELTKYWTGNYPQNRAPKVDSMTVDGKRAIENIFLKKNKNYIAKVFASEPDEEELRYEYIISEEVKERSEGGAFESEPKSFSLEIVSNKNGEITFVAPSNSGEYRIFCYVYDGNNKVGTANVPFYVE